MLRTALALVLLITAPGLARGQGVDAQVYRPALDSNGILSTESARPLGRWKVAMSLATSWAREPLRLDTVGDADRDEVIDSQLTVHLGLGIGITDRLTLGMSLPVSRQELGDGYGEVGVYDPTREGPRLGGTGFYSVRPAQNQPPSETPPGDLRIGAKLGLTRGRRAFAAQLVFHAPFGDDQVFAGSRGVTVEPRVLADFTFSPRLLLAVNAGLRIREGTLLTTRQVDDDGNFLDDAMTGAPVYIGHLWVGTEAAVGAALRFQLGRRVDLLLESQTLVPVTGNDNSICTAANDCTQRDIVTNLLAGLKVRMTSRASLGLAGGSSLLQGAARAPDIVVVAGLSFTPGRVAPTGMGPGDDDGDGIDDQNDICPEEPEDADDFTDDDGCPDLDDDGDSVVDATDQCPRDPEDLDGFEDDDGCSDPDNDGDGTIDLADQCPLEAEDKDGFDDDDGCAEGDNDGDGIADGGDRCPGEPESLNGFEDEDGCPDASADIALGAVRVEIPGNAIEFQGTGTTLTAESRKLLDQVAATLMKPENRGVRIRIEVGIEESPRGKAGRAADRALTQQRADAVVAYLVDRGVPATRLDAVGLGSERPLDARNPRDRSRNRRVELIRVTQ